MSERQRRQSRFRLMFKAGMTLRDIYGIENICDFSLGYSKQKPPREVITRLQELSTELDVPEGLAYLPNEGAPEVRKLLVPRLSQEQQTNVSPRHIVLTCGASGAMNCLLRAVLSPGDEVLCPSPYYPDYEDYVNNFGGTFCPVPSLETAGFHLNLDAFAKALTEHTRVVILNTPNNPTGVVYHRDELENLSALLAEANRKYSRPILLFVDESCRFLTFNGIQIPPVFSLYPYSAIACSFSKSAGLAGERIGYALVNPAMPECNTLVQATSLANRMLGYIDAPTIGQHLLTAVLDIQPDRESYARQRQLMAEILADADIECQMPEGSLFLFPKVPGTISDFAFTCLLAMQKIFVLGGSCYNCPGHFRIALCSTEQTVERSRDGFLRAARLARLLSRRPFQQHSR